MIIKLQDSFPNEQLVTPYGQANHFQAAGTYCLSYRLYDKVNVNFRITIYVNTLNAEDTISNFNFFPLSSTISPSSLAKMTVLSIWSYQLLISVGKLL